MDFFLVLKIRFYDVPLNIALFPPTRLRWRNTYFHFSADGSISTNKSKRLLCGLNASRADQTESDQLHGEPSEPVNATWRRHISTGWPVDVTLEDLSFFGELHGKKNAQSLSVTHTHTHWVAGGPSPSASYQPTAVTDLLTLSSFLFP